MAGDRFPETRYLDPDPTTRPLALALYRAGAGLPLVCPHGHVDPHLFVDPGARFDNPAQLFVTPDHYILRLLYARGVPLEALGIAPLEETEPVEVEGDPRQIWQAFAEHFYLFRGTPTGIWIREALYQVFGIEEKLTEATAGAIYETVAAALADPAYSPRRLYERFDIEVLCTTDPATSDLAAHEAIRAADWGGVIRPTFRPDDLFRLDAPGWPAEVAALGAAAGVDVHDYTTFVQALEAQRARFKALGATATDHGVASPYTTFLAPQEADAIFQRALRGEATAADTRQFTGHMLVEMARMSVEDGLVMQIHPGSWRNYNRWLYQRFGPDRGADIPVRTGYTRNLHPLLERFGNDGRLSLILFTLDETAYARELAPLAGHYPSVLLGPPWWFHDSLNGFRRYFDRVMETASIYNTAGFNDDTRAFPSIPARHDLWRRASANWLAGLVARQIVDETDAHEMMQALAYGLAKRAYRLRSDT